MKLLTTELRGKLPKLNATERQPVGKRLVYAHFFTPDSTWHWYPLEFDGKNLFFGLVAGHYLELGDFRLSELEQVRGPFGLPVERDRYWQPLRIAEIAARHDGLPGVESFLEE